MVFSLKTPSENVSADLRAFFPSMDPLLANSKQKEIGLYDAHNVDDCPWPQTLDGQYAKSFLTPLIKRGISEYIENVETDLRALIVDDWVLPITINHTEYKNSFICSPYSYFISYPTESLAFISQAWIRQLIKSLLAGLGKALRQFQVNQVIIVNNWPYSTNLYPQLEPEQVLRVVQFLQQTFPDHAIVFRSIDPYTNPILYQTLQQIGFDYIAARQIFFIEPHISSLFESRLFKSDMKLLKNSGYEVIDGEQLREEDIPRIVRLYCDLYICKYSNLNPKFTEKFLLLALEKKLLQFKALKKGGCIDGVVGYVQRNGKMYCPFFGYDHHIPKEKALYRLLSTLLMLEAYNQRLFFHQSSGASMFKRIRKAHSCIEYTAVFCKHLKIQRHLPWLMIKKLYNSSGAIYYMKRY